MMFAPAITTVFLLGVFWKRGTKQAALATFAAGILIGLAYFLADLPHNVRAAEVMPAIQAKRVTSDRVMQQWVALSKADVPAMLAAGIPRDRILDDWSKIPHSVRMAVIGQNKWTAEMDAKEKVADRYVALPGDVLQPAMKAGTLSQEKAILTAGAVPADDLTAAIATGTLPEDWIVPNYGRVTYGLGIPFMMMGIILTAVCIGVYVAVSLLTEAPPREELEKMGWRSPLAALTETRITGLSDARVVAIGLVVLMVVLYILMR
jgi:hypothetical protein